jgi:opacity protein-like surface antigen
MRLKLLIAGIVLATAVGHAKAADLFRPPIAQQAAEPVEVSVPTFRTGCYAQASGGLGIGEVEGELFGDKVTVSDTDWLIGAGIGCDYIKDRFLIGGFGRFDWSGVKVADEVKFDHKWSLAARAGYIVAPHVLAYALGGAVWQDIDFVGSQQGWMLGGGVEILLSQHLSIFGEYANEFYDDENVQGIKLEPGGQVVRAGVSYRF